MRGLRMAGSDDDQDAESDGTEPGSSAESDGSSPKESHGGEGSNRSPSQENSSAAEVRVPDGDESAPRPLGGVPDWGPTIDPPAPLPTNEAPPRSSQPSPTRAVSPADPGSPIEAAPSMPVRAETLAKYAPVPSKENDDLERIVESYELTKAIVAWVLGNPVPLLIWVRDKATEVSEANPAATQPSASDHEQAAHYGHLRRHYEAAADVRAVALTHSDQLSGTPIDRSWSPPTDDPHRCSIPRARAVRAPQLVDAGRQPPRRISDEVSSDLEYRELREFSRRMGVLERQHEDKLRKP